MSDDIQSSEPQQGSGETDDEIWNEMIANEQGDTAPKTDAVETALPADPATPGVDGDEDNPAQDAANAKPAETDPPADQDDPWKDVPEPLKEQFEAANQRAREMEHKYLSENGRVAALTRKVDSLSKQRTSAPMPEQTADASQGDPSQTKAGADPNQQTPPQQDLTKIESEYPELKPLIDAVAAGKAQIDQLSARDEQQLEDFRSQELASFNQRHPDGFTIVNQNVAEFNAWLETQPKTFWDTAQANQEHIVNGEAAAILIDHFKAHLAAGSGDPTPNPKPLETKRQKQIEGAQGPAASGRNPITQGLPDNASDAEIWEEMRRKDEAAERRARL